MELEGQHYLVYQSTKRKKLLEYKIMNPEEKSITLMRLNGLTAQNTHEALLDIIGRKLYSLSLNYSKDEEKRYLIRLDAASIVLAYMILTRRSISKKWRIVLEELVDGRLRDLQKWFTYFSDVTIDLSKALGHGERSVLSPKALDAVSSGMKVIFQKLIGRRFTKSVLSNEYIRR